MKDIIANLGFSNKVWIILKILKKFKNNLASEKKLNVDYNKIKNASLSS